MHPTREEYLTNFEPGGAYRAGALLDAAHAVLTREPGIGAMLSLDLRRVRTDAELVAAALAGCVAADAPRSIVYEAAIAAFEGDGTILASVIADLHATYRKDGEPGSVASTLLFARGAQALTGHRVAHHFWLEGRRDFAFGVKTLFARVFATDIHPGVKLGSGLWLDHGLGLVAGETAVIEDDVSIWHGVTLGSNLRDRGEGRHPRLRRGCTIGAGAIILGRTDVGEGAVVAAGSVVLRDVAPFTTVAGSPAKEKARTERSFQGFATPSDGEEAR